MWKGVSSVIINIHGFRGEGNNSKYKWLCANIPRHAIYSPTFDYVNENPRSILEHLLNRVMSYLRENPGNPMGVYVVGNSLGGFFARCINQAYPGVTALLVNPSLAPFLRLWKDLAIHQRQAYLDLCAKYAYSDEYEDGNHERLHVIIGDSDELIDHETITKPLLPSYCKNIYTIRGGTHHLGMTPEAENIFKRVIPLPKEGKMDGDGDPRHIHFCGANPSEIE
jgi:predicted esterase YcpF (UPF0227 family)